jgi:low temperature requirement protein LtrA
MMGRLYEYTSLSRKHGVIGVDKVFDKIHDVMADVSPKLMYTADIEEIASPELYHAIAQLGNYIQNYGHLYIALGAVLIAGGLLYLFREDLSRGIRSLVSRFKR